MLKGPDENTMVPEPVEGDTTKPSPTRRPLRSRRGGAWGGDVFFFPSTSSGTG